MEKKALVTGASKGIGLEISKILISNGYEVIGIARDFSKTNLENKNFKKLSMDLCETDKFEKNLKFLKNSDHLHILVHCAGMGIFGYHEELSSYDLEKMLVVNFVSPILLTRLLLRSLKKNKGYIFQISSITAKQDSPLASAYAATKAGLTHFGSSLFLEARKSGLKIINLHPDITKSEFYNNTWFEPELQDPESFLEITSITNLFETIISRNSNEGYLDISIKPQKHKIKNKRTRLFEIKQKENL